MIQKTNEYMRYERSHFETKLPSESRRAIDQFKVLTSTEHLLPIKVTPFYQKKIDEEVAAIGPGGPLFKTAYPTPERLSKRAPGEVTDFVTDVDNMPQELENTLIRKYENRAVYTPTHNCAGHCQYCFRTDLLSQIHQNHELMPSFEQGLTATINYLNANPEVNEVIFSGGDPMTLNPRLLETALTLLDTETDVKNFRIHTRTIVFTPGVFKDYMTDLLAQHNVRLYFHITHPYEIDDPVEETIQKMRNKGIRTYNQSPLLRGINDHPDVLEKLLVKLDELGTRQVSIFIADPH